MKKTTSNRMLSPFKNLKYSVFLSFSTMVLFTIISCIKTFYGHCLDDPCYTDQCSEYVEDLEAALGRERMMTCTWYFLTQDGGIDGDHEEDGDFDAASEDEGDADFEEFDTDFRNDVDTDEKECTPQAQLSCNDDSDVIWLDSCGQTEEGIVEDCPDENGYCRNGVCVCGEGWTGEECEKCVIFVNGPIGDDSNAGRSWRDALATVSTGLGNASVSRCDIWVATGIYYPTEGTSRDATFQLLSGIGLYGGFAGTESSIDERNIEENETVLSGDIDQNGIIDNGNVYHVVIGSNDSIIDGFTITGGNANHPDSSDHRVNGGGMYNGSTSPLVSNCTFSRNSAFRGGGMSNRSGASPTIMNCNFFRNRALRNGGGGIHNNESSPSIVNCTFSNNTSEQSGGGISNYESSSPVVTNCVFTDNYTGLCGGGMDNGYSSHATVTDCTFLRNEAAICGGGMTNAHSSTPTIHNCIFLNNNARSGGGMHNLNESSAIVTNCSFFGNEAAQYGGGMWNEESSPTITSCIFSNNYVVSHDGGGMHNNRSSPTLINCTFSDNYSGVNGHGMSNYFSSSIITNSIFWGDLTSSGYQIYTDDEESIPIITFSDIRGGWDGEGNIDVDPLLDESLRLRDGSPCIDAGDNSVLTEEVTDLDGNSRIVDGDGDSSEVVDMGAYELDPSL